MGDRALVNVSAHGVYVGFPEPEEDLQSIDGASVTEDASAKMSYFATRAAT